MYFSHICHFRPMTQPNPTRGSTQPMDNSAPPYYSQRAVFASPLNAFLQFL